MLETPHVAVGAAIAVKVANPLISLPLAFGSHFLLDRIPHWNPHTYTETQKHGKLKKSSLIVASIDTSAALILGFTVALTKGGNLSDIFVIILACFLSVLPDVVKYPYFLFHNRNGILKKYINWERSIQVETGVLVGMIIQITIVLSSMYWIWS